MSSSDDNDDKKNMTRTCLYCIYGIGILATFIIGVTYLTNSMENCEIECSNSIIVDGRVINPTLQKNETDPCQHCMDSVKFGRKVFSGVFIFLGVTTFVSISMIIFTIFHTYPPWKMFYFGDTHTRIRGTNIHSSKFRNVYSTHSSQDGIESANNVKKIGTYCCIIFFFVVATPLIYFSMSVTYYNKPPAIYYVYILIFMSVISLYPFFFFATFEKPIIIDDDELNRFLTQTHQSAFTPRTSYESVYVERPYIYTHGDSDRSTTYAMIKSKTNVDNDGTSMEHIEHVYDGKQTNNFKKIIKKWKSEDDPLALASNNVTRKNGFATICDGNASDASDNVGKDMYNEIIKSDSYEEDSDGSFINNVGGNSLGKTTRHKTNLHRHRHRHRHNNPVVPKRHHHKKLKKRSKIDEYEKDINDKDNVKVVNTNTRKSLALSNDQPYSKDEYYSDYSYSRSLNGSTGTIGTIKSVEVF
jgi:hypothetical protein